MIDRDPSHRPSIDEVGYKNNPHAVITDHLIRTIGTDGQVPAGMEWAAEITRTRYPRRAALGVCIDLNTTGSNATTVLAEMFAAGHEALPEQWRTNPEITRTVLTMSGHIEIGLLRAQQASLAHEGGNPHIESRLNEVEHFVEELQQK